MNVSKHLRSIVLLFYFSTHSMGKKFVHNNLAIILFMANIVFIYNSPGDSLSLRRESDQALLVESIVKNLLKKKSGRTASLCHIPYHRPK
jgi:hypothetical protein